MRDHTRDVREQAAREIENASDKKYLPVITTEPTVFIHIDYYQILMVVKYYSDLNRRAEIKNGIVAAISRQIPGAIDTGR